MTIMKHSLKRKVLEIIGIAIAIPLFFMLLVTVTDKLAHGTERMMKEVLTYSIDIQGVSYNIPTIVPKDFATWPISLQRTSNPEYGIIQWTNPETGTRLTAIVHIHSGDIKVAAFGTQGVEAINWWIWKDDGKVYEVDNETAMEYLEYLEKSTSV